MDVASFHKLLAFGVERGVSDIHFEAGYPPHYRLGGELLGALKVSPLRPIDTEEIAKHILDGRGLRDSDAIDFGRPFRELDVSYALPGSARFRASIFRQRGSVGVVLRIIPIKVKGFADLNLPKSLGEIAEARRGLVLVTGATGNGKTTTIAAMLKHLNETRRAHIVTIEDPIEYLFEPGKCMIIQRELGTDTASFKDALDAAMRQDPDVIMLGEVRERETAETCLKAAETGHLVISAIHTPDAVATVQRYVGFFDRGFGRGANEQDYARERLADALQAVVSLRLLTSKDKASRVPAIEILRVTRTVREHIKQPGRLGEITELMRKGRDLYGMQLFDQHLLELLTGGKISLETALYASSNPEELERSTKIE